MKNLGEKIREYRTSIKMTQADFAWRLGVTGASVSAYENGTRLPSYDVLIRIANILGVSTDALLGRRNNGDVTIDVTPLTNEQRLIVQKTVDIFSEANRLRMSVFKEDSIEDRLNALGYLDEAFDGDKK